MWCSGFRDGEHGNGEDGYVKCCLGAGEEERKNVDTLMRSTSTLIGTSEIMDAVKHACHGRIVSCSNPDFLHIRKYRYGWETTNS